MGKQSKNLHRKKRRNKLKRENQEWRRLRTRRRRASDKYPSKRLTRSNLGLNIWSDASPIRLSRPVLEIPEVFSLIDNTEQTLGVLRRASQYLKSGARELHLDHRICKQLDLGASAVLDVLLLRGKREYRRRPPRYSGTYSITPQVNFVLRTMGAVANLHHPHKVKTSAISEFFLPFELKVGRRSSPGNRTDNEALSTSLIDFFDSCVAKHGFKLQRAWKTNVASMLSEAIDNAEQHSRTDEEWYLAAYYQQDTPDDPDGTCHLVMFNFGDTIFESLQQESTSYEVKQRIVALVKHHTDRKFFDFTSKRWREESLWVLYALQDGVSRYKDSEGGEDRGKGTVKMLEALAQLSAEDRQMVIVSGSTCILIDGAYTVQEEDVDGNKQKIIAFNPQNSLLDPPDERAVKSLDARFPGTLISLRFKMKKSDLAQKRDIVVEKDSEQQ